MGRFNATIKDGHEVMLTRVFGQVNGGILPDAATIVELGNLAGALNEFKAHPEKFVPYGYKRQGDAFVPDSTPPGPTPPPSDPLEAFRARQAVSQNCAWVQITPAESGALRDVYGDVVSQYNQFYTVGGSGGLGIAERPDASSPSGYVYVNANQEWAPDVNQAADKRVAELAEQQGRTVPPPLG